MLTVLKGQRYEEMTILVPEEFFEWYRHENDLYDDLDTVKEEWGKLDLEDQIEDMHWWYHRPERGKKWGALPAKPIEITVENASEIFERETADAKPYPMEAHK